jgi:hypothetical protein
VSCSCTFKSLSIEICSIDRPYTLTISHESMQCTVFFSQDTLPNQIDFPKPLSKPLYQANLPVITTLSGQIEISTEQWQDRPCPGHVGGRRRTKHYPCNSYPRGNEISSSFGSAFFIYPRTTFHGQEFKDAELKIPIFLI